ncbi:MAG TPA: uroporphyrinogen decarboxylase [Deltaproteobacteria bacterium]|nr:uroporphyrinogen decarboxylase [Deltaproteobacteria bacterium]
MKNQNTPLTVISFESRMALPMQRLLEKKGIHCISAPTMKEVPLEENPRLFEFYEKLKNGEFDGIIFMTGVATRTLIKTLEQKFSKDEILETLRNKSKIIVRGPKPTAVCNRNNLPIFLTAPEPNTWREIISVLENHDFIKSKKLAIVEYGISNTDFINQLQKKGAETHPLQVYQWAMPDDLEPLNTAIATILTGKADLLAFTSAKQIENIMTLVKEKNLEGAFRRALYSTAITSIGPVTSEHLSTHQFFPDLEAKPHKMEALVELMAKKGLSASRQKKKKAVLNLVYVKDSQQITETKDIMEDSPFMRACRIKANSQIPVWLMRQAGRYMAEYQSVRKKGGFKDLCTNPDLATEVTITAVERLGLDAAIIFSDILLVCEAMGMRLTYEENHGPILGPPIRTMDDLKRLRPSHTATDMPFVAKAISQTRKHLHPCIPLIGFSGAPFTVAAYMIEGGASKNFIATKQMMHSEPSVWKKLMNLLVPALADLLNTQIAAGCQVVQIFDSWVGQLNSQDYETFVMPYTQKLVRKIKKGTPVIHFGSFNASSLHLQQKAGGDVLSIDWRVDIKQALQIIPKRKGIQGNLDPTLLFNKPKAFLPGVKKLLQAVGKRPGYIFNLGHGILPGTPVDHVMALVDYVHEWKM